MYDYYYIYKDTFFEVVNEYHKFIEQANKLNYNIISVISLEKNKIIITYITKTLEN